MFIQSRESKPLMVECELGENCTIDLFMIFLQNKRLILLHHILFDIFGEFKYPLGRLRQNISLFCIKVCNWLELPFQSDFDKRFKVCPFICYHRGGCLPACKSIQLSNTNCQIQIQKHTCYNIWYKHTQKTSDQCWLENDEIQNLLINVNQMMHWWPEVPIAGHSLIKTQR